MAKRVLSYLVAKLSNRLLCKNKQREKVYLGTSPLVAKKKKNFFLQVDIYSTLPLPSPHPTNQFPLPLPSPPPNQSVSPPPPLPPTQPISFCPWFSFFFLCQDLKANTNIVCVSFQSFGFERHFASANHQTFPFGQCKQCKINSALHTHTPQPPPLPPHKYHC